MHKLNRGVTTDVRHILYDVLGNVVVFVLCYVGFSFFGREVPGSLGTFLISVVFVGFYVLLCKDFKLYDTTTFFYADRVFRRVTLGAVLSAAIAAAVLFFTGQTPGYRMFYLVYFAASYVEFLIMLCCIQTQQKRNGQHAYPVYWYRKKL